MSFTNGPKALAKFLRSNDGSCDKLTQTWSPDVSPAYWSGWGLDEVLEAAKQNTSVRSFSMDAVYLERGEVQSAGTICTILRHLRSLESVDIYWLPPSLTDPSFSPLNAVDMVLEHGIAKSEANIKSLSLSLSVTFSHSVFLKFCERFPHLESLTLKDSRWGDKEVDYEEFVRHIGIAVARELRSLRRVSLVFRGMTSPLMGLLSHLGGAAATSLKELHIVVKDVSYVPNAWKVAHLCAMTRTIETLKITGQEKSDLRKLLDVTPLFQSWSRYPISNSIRELHFEWCRLNKARTLKGTLKNLEILRLENSYVFPDPGHSLVEILPHLKTFHFHITHNEIDFDDYDFDETPCVVRDNDELDTFCESIKDSLLQDIEIDLVGRWGGDWDSNFEQLASVDRLLKACKGKLVVNFHSLPIHSSYDIVGGLKSLHSGLEELRLRFSGCEFSDVHYARILEALRLNKTLTVFELGLGEDRLGDQTISSICNLLVTNDTLGSLSLLGLSAEEVENLLRGVHQVFASSGTSTMTLRQLKVNGVDLTDASSRLQLPITWNDPDATQVRHLLKLNRYGRRFLPPHEMPRPTEGLWATILARIAKDKAHEVMYTFLRAKPSLLESRKRKHS